MVENSSSEPEKHTIIFDIITTPEGARKWEEILMQHRMEGKPWMILPDEEVTGISTVYEIKEASNQDPFDENEKS